MATSDTLTAANQPSPLEGYNLYEQDAALVEGLQREGGGAWEEEVAASGPERARRAPRTRTPARDGRGVSRRGAPRRGSGTLPSSLELAAIVERRRPGS